MEKFVLFVMTWSGTASLFHVVTVRPALLVPKGNISQYTKIQDKEFHSLDYLLTAALKIPKESV